MSECIGLSIPHGNTPVLTLSAISSYSIIRGGFTRLWDIRHRMRRNKPGTLRKPQRRNNRNALSEKRRAAHSPRHPPCGILVSLSTEVLLVYVTPQEYELGYGIYLNSQPKQLSKFSGTLHPRTYSHESGRFIPTLAPTRLSHHLVTRRARGHQGR